MNAFRATLWRLLRVLCVLALATSLCGCVAQIIETNLTESQKIADRCDMIQEPFQASNESLSRRLRTALTFQVEKAQNSCQSAMENSLAEFVSMIESRAKNSQNRAIAEGLVRRLKGQLTVVANARKAVEESLEKIEKGIDAAERAKICANRRECATNVAALLDGSYAEVRNISGNLQALRAALDSIVADLAVASEVFRNGRDDLAFVVGEAERTLRVQQKLVETGLRIIADGDYDVILATYANERVVALFDKSARSVIKAVVRSMQPLEKSLESADSKTYGLVSLGRTLFKQDLQSEIDSAASEVKKRFVEAVQKSKGTNDDRILLQAHLSLARAACEKVLGPAAELDDAFLSPFLLNAIINTFTPQDLAALQKLVHPETAKDRTTVKTCNDDKGIAKQYDAAVISFTETYVGLDAEKAARSEHFPLRELKLNAVVKTTRTLRAYRAQAAEDMSLTRDLSGTLQSTKPEDLKTADERRKTPDELVNDAVIKMQSVQSKKQFDLLKFK